jgi:hypothetical protein
MEIFEEPAAPTPLDRIGSAESYATLNLKLRSSSIGHRWGRSLSASRSRPRSGESVGPRRQRSGIKNAVLTVGFLQNQDRYAVEAGADFVHGVVIHHS